MQWNHIFNEMFAKRDINIKIKTFNLFIADICLTSGGFNKTMVSAMDKFHCIICTTFELAENQNGKIFEEYVLENAGLFFVYMAIFAHNHYNAVCIHTSYSH